MVNVLITTNLGDFKLELDSEKAPITTENFLNYVKKEFFNATIFHRVIPGFVIQGGGFDAQMRQKPTEKNIENEASNQLKNERGSIAMARTNDPHT
ncbi:MAG: peptidylprolyl isomerase, partial [Silvanigrellaceae bacterium]|nr:peptidylprolyl isomerase [Silvanigrellaceae bacterium]